MQDKRIFMLLAGTADAHGAGRNRGRGEQHDRVIAVLDRAEKGLCFSVLFLGTAGLAGTTVKPNEGKVRGKGYAQWLKGADDPRSKAQRRHQRSCGGEDLDESRAPERGEAGGRFTRLVFTRSTSGNWKNRLEGVEEEILEYRYEDTILRVHGIFEGDYE